MDWLGLFVPLLLLLLFLVGGVRWYLRYSDLKAGREFSERYPGELLCKKSPANFFGIASRGMSQIRGNGSLFLTNRRLVFRLLVPKRWIEIPVKGIVRVENPRSFLGKSKGRKLLAVYFRRDGQDDSAAWVVSDLADWTRELHKVSTK